MTWKAWAVAILIPASIGVIGGLTTSMISNRDLKERNHRVLEERKAHFLDRTCLSRQNDYNTAFVATPEKMRFDFCGEHKPLFPVAITDKFK